MGGFPAAEGFSPEGDESPSDEMGGSLSPEGVSPQSDGLSADSSSLPTTKWMEDSP